MPIRINTNIFSLFVNRNLAKAALNLDDSYRNLSSGEKINRAGDDPAGLANSHGLRIKIASLQRNLMNANQGLNLTNVAESSLGSISENLQRLRELAIQSATATVSDSQRIMIQREVDELLEEMERVATAANYNEKNLLDGSFKDLRLQLGSRAGQSIAVYISDMRTSALGSIAMATGSLPVDGAAIAGTGDLILNGHIAPASQPDGVSAIDSATSAIAKSNAINTITYLTGITAKPEPALRVGSTTIASGSLDGLASSLTINGTNIGAVSFSGGDSSGVLQEKINSFSAATGVKATLGPANELILTASDGRNTEIVVTGSAASALGFPVGSTIVRGSITLSSANAMEIGGLESRLGFGPAQISIPIDPATAIQHLTLTTQSQAEAMLERIDSAIRQVTATRAEIGALQNRLDSSIDDIALQIENLTSADSRIRDADFAFETARMTQAQIIQEAGVAILAQANVIPQMALNLLQK